MDTQFLPLWREFPDQGHGSDGDQPVFQQHAAAQVALDRVLGQADQALYYAKVHGRNQVCFYDDLVASGHLGAEPAMLRALRYCVAAAVGDSD